LPVELMLSAIDLDDQFVRVAVEIGNVGPHRNLTPEFQPLKSFPTQGAPQPSGSTLTFGAHV
jgi:hypothetical protein